MLKLFLAFNGRARHGKTLAAESIAEYLKQWDLPTVGIYDVGAFILRQAIKQGRLPEGTQRPTMTPEQLLVLIEMGRDSLYWIKEVVAAIESEAPHVALIPNVRYPIQADVVKEHGGVNICCTRYNRDGSIYICNDRPPNDPGETLMQSYTSDYYLSSRDGDAGWMKEQAIALFEYLWESKELD